MITLDASEVRMLDNCYALLFIRGEMPVMDEKYDLLNHPNKHNTRFLNILYPK